MAIIHFVADVHLRDDKPDTWTDFFDYLNGPARQANVVYLLGDIFEAWIGDDDERELANQIRTILLSLTNAGVKVNYVFGNHDFMIHKRFAKETKVTLKGDREAIEIESIKMLLIHGDILCTSEIAFLKARRKMLNPLYLMYARRLPREKRIQRAEQILKHKDQSDFSPKNLVIDEDLVSQLLKKYDASVMIHGHVHQPNYHDLKDNKQRWVLPAWSGGGGLGGWLVADNGKFSRAGKWAQQTSKS